MMSASQLRTRQAPRLHHQPMSAFPALRLVASRPEALTVRPGPELCRAVAITVARHFRGLWVPSGLSAADILELISRHVVEVRGFRHPEDIEAIVIEAISIMAEIESAAEAAFRRPPRRRRSRVVRGEQLAFQFGDAA